MTRLLCAAVALLALAGCTGRLGGDNRLAAWTPLAPQPVGQTAGDTIEELPGAIQERPATVVSVVRAFDDGGMLSLCGAVILAGTKAQLPELNQFLRDVHSELEIGPSSDPLRVSPAFMRAYDRETPTGLYDTKTIDYSRLEGNCVRTARPWRAEYRSANRLNLRKTTYVSRGPVFITLPARR